MRTSVISSASSSPACYTLFSIAVARRTSNDSRRMGMANNERSVETSASPATVWQVWSNTATWQEWNPDVQSMTLNGPFATGTSGTMTTKQGTRQVQLTSVVPGRSFQLETTVIPLTRFAFECQVIAGPAGKTTIR